MHSGVSQKCVGLRRGSFDLLLASVGLRRRSAGLRRRSAGLRRRSAGLRRTSAGLPHLTPTAESRMGGASEVELAALISYEAREGFSHDQY